MFRDDSAHVPYGTRTPGEILGFIEPIFQSMIDDGCSVIVIACNTVTTTLIDTVRERFPIPFVGIEPMVKPAAGLTNSGVIAVCATPLTLRSPRYEQLKREYAADITVLEPDCSDWARMIEHDAVDDEKIGRQIDEILEHGADVIVLACTHYHWIEEIITTHAAGKAAVIQPEHATIEQLERVLRTL